MSDLRALLGDKELLGAREDSEASAPGLDMPPVRWVAPAEVSADTLGPIAAWEVSADALAPFAAWGHVYLCAYRRPDYDAPFLEVGDERYTVAEAKALLNRLASAIAMAEVLKEIPETT